MKELVNFELFVGLTGSMKAALEIATRFSGMKASTYGRQAIMEKLVREQFLKHPLADLAPENTPAVQAK